MNYDACLFVTDDMTCVCVTGVIMGSVVFLARKCHVNPDNIATPVAGTLGDISTLTILAYVSSALFSTLCK